MKLYPLKFKPILKSIIWGGGNEICKFKGVTPEEEGIGESWEISSVEAMFLSWPTENWKTKALME